MFFSSHTISLHAVTVHIGERNVEFLEVNIYGLERNSEKNKSMFLYSGIDGLKKGYWL